MAEYQRVEYLIGKNGKVTERVIKATGATCTETTAELEQALGMITSQEKLPEYYEQPNELHEDNAESLYDYQ